MSRWTVAFALSLLAAPLRAQEAPTLSDSPILLETPSGACEAPSRCIPKEHMDVFLKVLKEKQCLQKEAPTFELEPINIIVDREGRVFYTGAQPHPYTVKMHWCSYDVEAQGQVDLIVGKEVPDIWGFRFRPKAYISALPFEPLYDLPEGSSYRVMDLVDAGLMVDFLYYDFVNLNVAAGFHSFGGGLGFDLTANFGVFGAYALSWGDWHHNLNVGLWFSFWNG